jgi:hypothetical protein
MIMKKALILPLLLLTLAIGGCANNSSDVQQAVGGVWEAQLTGGSDTGQGFSFEADFSVSGSGGSLSFANFQFLTSGACFPVSSSVASGAMALVVNQNNFSVTGTLDLTVTANGNVLKLNGNVTGTENGTQGTQLTGGMVTGTWTLTGNGSGGCNDSSGASGSFTMCQSSGGSSSTCSASTTQARIDQITSAIGRQSL